MQELLVDDADGVRTITINRPDAKNALTTAMRARLCELLSETERDPAVKAVVLTAVDPVFCAGVDFKEVASGASGWNAHDAQFTVNPGSALRAMLTPVICAVNGACVSGGLEIALSSTFVVASERARFADTHARLGVVATWGLTALLPRAIGIRRAREMSITGNFVDADEALRIGLVNHVVPHEELLDFARSLANDIADTPAVAEVLRLYARGDGMSLAEALALETDHVTRRSFDPAAFGAAGRSTAARNRYSS
ncbi:MAG TPA: enoyl-CoA hydratase [Acidimicrobiales bacterium]